MPNPKTSFQDLGQSRKSSRVRKRLKKTVGRVVRPHSLRGSDKPDSQTPLPSGSGAEPARRLTGQGRKVQVSATPSRGSGPLDKGKVLGDAGDLTDSSKPGWVVVDDQGKCWKGRWSQEEISLHINVLELRTILLAVRALNPKDQDLVVWSDNQTAISVIRRLGSYFPDLQRLASLLLGEMEQRRISITPRHIAGKQNVAADALSREEVIPGEWELSVQTFTSLVAQHDAELQVDLFTSPLSHKLPVLFCTVHARGLVVGDLFKIITKC